MKTSRWSGRWPDRLPAYQMRSARRNLIYSCRTAQEKLGWTDTWTQKAAGAR